MKAVFILANQIIETIETAELSSREKALAFYLAGTILNSDISEENAHNLKLQQTSPSESTD